jgi:hypothetical protein
MDSKLGYRGWGYLICNHVRSGLWTAGPLWVVLTKVMGLATFRQG